MNIADVQAVVAGAVGGENVTETVEGGRASRSTCATPRVARRRSAWPSCRSSRRRGQQVTLGSIAS